MQTSFTKIVGRALFALSIFFLIPTTSRAQGMVPSNILMRVLSLKYGNQTATGFTVEIDGRQYLVTARHLLPTNPSSGAIEIFHEDQWKKFDFEAIPVEPASVDIAVLALKLQLTPILPIQIGIKNSFLSEEVFFVGFPYGLQVEGQNVNNGYPIPLVKHGVIAGFGKESQFLVDGTNNPGFSGGPIVTVKDTSNPTIVGVVSGYRVEIRPVQNGNVDTNLTVGLNTGLIVGYSLDRVVDAVRKKPIGFLLPVAK